MRPINWQTNRFRHGDMLPASLALLMLIMQQAQIEGGGVFGVHPANFP